MVCAAGVQLLDVPVHGAAHAALNEKAHESRLAATRLGFEQRCDASVGENVPIVCRYTTNSHGGYLPLLVSVTTTPGFVTLLLGYTPSYGTPGRG
jgi:hypothetical protein